MVFAESMEGQNVVSRWSLFERNLASVWVTFSGAGSAKNTSGLRHFDVFASFAYLRCGDFLFPQGLPTLWSMIQWQEKMADQVAEGNFEVKELLRKCLPWKTAKGLVWKTWNIWKIVYTDKARQPEVYDWRFWKSGVLGPLEKTSEIRFFQYINESLLFEALLSSTPESYNLILHAQNIPKPKPLLRMTLWMVWLAWCNPAAWVLSNPTAFWHSGPKMCWPWVEKVSRGDPTWWPGNGKTQEVRFFLIYFPYIFTIFHGDGNVFSIQFQCILHFLILLDEEGCWRMSLAVSG